MPLSKEQQTVQDRVNSLLELLPVLSNLERQCIDNTSNLAWLSDTTFVCRKAVEVLEQLQKKVEELEHQVAKHACLTLGLAKLKNYKGEHCTVSPNPSYYVAYPNGPDKEGYTEFVKQLAPELIRPHYPSIGEAVTVALEQGKQVPFGLSGTIHATPKLRVTMRKSN